MLICPQCNTLYPDGIENCARENAPLSPLIDVIESRKSRSSGSYLGEIIGNYRIDQKIATGGMGTVYQATHLTIGKEVAIKILHDDQTEDETTLKRFYNEARAAGRIESDNVAKILDFGCANDGRVFLVMELLVGQTLEQLLKETTLLNPQRAVQIAIQICHGLDAAHQQKIVHRDLKPDNIFLCDLLGAETDLVKILDFGIAKDIGLPEHSPNRLTIGRQILGTPKYMAPEQGLANENKPGIVDQRTDIYSLGTILCRMLTGRVPFDGSNAMEILCKHCYEAPTPIREIDETLPESLEKIALRCLEKLKEDRYNTAAQLATELESVALQDTMFPMGLESGEDPHKTIETSPVVPIELLVETKTLETSTKENIPSSQIASVPPNTEEIPFSPDEFIDPLSSKTKESPSKNIWSLIAVVLTFLFIGLGLGWYFLLPYLETLKPLSKSTENISSTSLKTAVPTTENPPKQKLKQTETLPINTSFPTSAPKSEPVTPTPSDSLPTNIPSSEKTLSTPPAKPKNVSPKKSNPKKPEDKQNPPPKEDKTPSVLEKTDTSLDITKKPKNNDSLDTSNTDLDIAKPKKKP